MSAQDTYEALTARIISQLESGVAPWVRPWSVTGLSDRPTNFLTRQPYHGSNVLALWLAQAASGYPTAQFLTFVQAKQIGASVRKGEHGTHIVFAGPVLRKRQLEDGTTELVRGGSVLRGHVVFNVAQIDGLELPPAAPVLSAWEALDEAETFIAAIGADVRHGGDSAFYSPSGDFVQLPARGAFANRESYYGTALHEHAHWTGHTSRLAREFGNRFGDQAYAFEELVAELTAAFLTADLAIPGKLQHPEYLGHWASVLRDDKNALWTAASQATKAATYLHELAAASSGTLMEAA